MEKITRRLFLRSTAAAGAVGVAVATPSIVEAAAQGRAELTAIPSDVVEKITAWQSAHRECVRATNAYAASLRMKPVDKDVAGQCYADMVHAERAVGPAREAMIMALWSV